MNGDAMGNSGRPRVLVVGLGNDLATDEGLGPHAVRRLAERGLPADVEAIDARTDLMAVADEMERAGRVILVDAIQAGGEPGTVYRWTLDELLERAARAAAPLSGHGLELVGWLRLAQATGMRMPPTVIYGIEPAAIAFGMELTPRVEQAMGEMIDAMLIEMASY
jgi:hydrogenase maturation protease